MSRFQATKSMSVQGVPTQRRHQAGIGKIAPSPRKAVIRLTVDQILADFDDPIVQMKAEELTTDATSDRERIENIFHHVRDDIVFAFPEHGDLITASDTIRLGVGQCNTKSTLFLALCRAVGIPARVHYSLISRDIQKGFFTGLAFWAMPK